MALEPMLLRPERVRLRDGRLALVRPTRRSDAPLVQAFIRGLSAASRYERFFAGLRELPPSLLARVVEPPDVSLLALTAYEDRRSRWLPWRSMGSTARAMVPK